MTIYLGVCIIGVFALKDGKVLDSILFANEPDAIVSKMKKFADGEGFEELDELILKLGDAEIDRGVNNPCGIYLKKNLRMLALGKGIQPADLNKLLSQMGIARSKSTIKTTKKRDKIIVQCVSSLNDLNKILNTMSERLREWYGLHYPELRIRDHEKMAKRVAKYGNRKNFEDFSKSMGTEFDEQDTEMVQLDADNLKNLYSLRRKMETYLDKMTREEIPNLRVILGGTLAARMLAQAGTLERLAKMPSSKLQLLSAEKSMFRFMREKKQGMKSAKCPKYGVIFTHLDISGAPAALRGKIARLLASKASMAARIDFYSKEDRSKALMADYQKKKAEVLKFRKKVEGSGHRKK